MGVDVPRLSRVARAVSFVCLAAVATVVLALLNAGTVSASQWPAVVGAFALFMAGNFCAVKLRFGHSHLDMTFGVAAILVAGSFTQPIPFVIAAAASAVAGELVIQREAVKRVFNASLYTFAAGVFVAVASVGYPLGHLTTRPSALGWIAAGGAATAALSHVLVSSVVAAAQGLKIRDVVFRGLQSHALLHAAEIGLGVLCVVLESKSPWTLAVLPVLAALLVLVNRANFREMKERETWAQLEKASRELKTLSEPTVIDQAIARSSRLLHADWAEVDVRSPVDPDEVLRHHGGHDGVTEQHTIAASEVFTLGESDLRETVDDRGTVLEQRIPGTDGDLGVLRVCFGPGAKIADRERQVMEAYSRSVSSTLLNARLYAEAVAEADRKAWQVNHDPLTELINRTGLLAMSDQVDAAIADGERMAVFLIDIDHFKVVNEVLGHASADRLLQHMASVLSSRARRGDTVARISGDQFLVLMRELDMQDVHESMPEQLAEGILAVVARPHEHEGMRLSLDASAGVAVAPRDGKTLSELMSHADTALADAKKTPGSARRWMPGRDETSKEHLALSAELRSGIANDEIVLHYQPQIDLRTGAVGCAEALARWQHPERGLLGPGEFVPVAERTGLIREFTTAVLNIAVREASHWRTMGLGGGEVSVAVNLSARNLLDRELPADVAVILARHGLPARQLVLEITETVMMSELEVVEDVVGRLRALGVQVSVDDFGTGYSSLKFLQKIQVNEVKIDQSFVQSMMASEGDAAIVRATVELAHGLGLRVCAEGVEDQDVVEALSALGCDSAQGFHLARPMPADVMREMLMPSSGIVVPLHKVRRTRGLA